MKKRKVGLKPIGKSIYNELKIKYDITSVSRSNFDLSNYQDTCNWFRQKQYDVIIHTAVCGGVV